MTTKKMIATTITSNYELSTLISALNKDQILVTIGPEGVIADTAILKESGVLINSGMREVQGKKINLTESMTMDTFKQVYAYLTLKHLSTTENVLYLHTELDKRLLLNSPIIIKNFVGDLYNFIKKNMNFEIAKAILSIHGGVEVSQDLLDAKEIGMQENLYSLATEFLKQYSPEDLEVLNEAGSIPPCESKEVNLNQGFEEKLTSLLGEDQFLVEIGAEWVIADTAILKESGELEALLSSGMREVQKKEKKINLTESMDMDTFKQVYAYLTLKHLSTLENVLQLYPALDKLRLKTESSIIKLFINDLYVFIEENIDVDTARTILKIPNASPSIFLPKVYL